MERSQETFTLAMLIRDIYSQCMNQISQRTADSGLSHQQIMVIRLIAHKKSIQVSELCKEMSLTKGTVSGILNRMEAAGLIEKYKNKKDQRNTYIRFSEKGQELAKNFRTKIVDSFDQVFVNFSDAELLQSKDALTLIQQKLMKEETI
ncbi:MAG: MarR family transcriptional regulator [Eubacteriales bacterium]